MPSIAKDLLHRMADHAQMQFAINNGTFRIPQWLTQNASGEKIWFETPCRKTAATDHEVIAMLVAEQRADFAYDRVVAFAVAYVATMKQVRWISAVQFEPERTIEGIVIEAHDRDAGHWRTHCEIIQDPLRLGPLASLEAAPTSLFAGLLEPA
jgi:hypothetical protein